MSLGSSVGLLFGASSLLSGVGTGMDAYGAYQEAQAYNRAADYNSATELHNAQYYEVMAKNATALGAKEASDLRREGKVQIGSQRAGYAASGVLVDEGSALDVSMDTASEIEYDAQTILYNADVERFGYEQKANSSRTQAQMHQASKRNASLNAGRVVLNGVTSAIGRFANTL